METTDKEVNPNDQEKMRYFSRQAAASLSKMRLNKKTGLFPKTEGWRNVVEHELVEAEAVEVLAEKLGLSHQDREDLKTAALLHDVFKRKEIELAKSVGSGGFDEAARAQSEWLASIGIKSEIIGITESVGYTNLRYFLDEFDSVPITKKIMHYVDDITLNSDIVSLDAKFNYLENNSDYRELNQQGRDVFNGQSYFEVQKLISERIEKELAEKIGIENPSDLPGFIRLQINARIVGDK